MTAALKREILEKVPPACGVYLFYGDDDRLLYVGKSKNLRKRMSVYFSGNGVNRETRPAWRRGRIRRFDWMETPSELTALLLEDFWIKELKPNWNIRQAQMKERCWLAFQPEKIPPVRITSKTPTGRFIGPLKDEYFARRLWNSLARFLKLPDCRNVNAGRCLRRQTGQCLAPCSEELPNRAYIGALKQVEKFLDGETEELEELIREEMQRESAVMRFERAALLREELLFWRQYRRRQVFINCFNRQPLLIREFDQYPVWHLFDRNGYHFGTGGSCHIKWAPLLIPDRANPLYRYDAAQIVYAFLKNHTRRLSLRWLESGETI